MRRRNLPIHLDATVPGAGRFPVLVASGLWGRIAGIRAAAPGWGVLLAGRAVHGRRLEMQLTVIAIDAHGTVLASHILQPGASWRHRRASWMLELPGTHRPVPKGGVRLWRRRNYTPLHDRR